MCGRKTPGNGAVEDGAKAEAKYEGSLEKEKLP